MAHKIATAYTGLTTDRTQATSVARQDIFLDFYDVHEVLGKYVDFLFVYN